MAIKIVLDKNTKISISQKTYEEIIHALTTFKKWYSKEPNQNIETNTQKEEKEDRVNPIENEKVDSIVYYFRGISFYNPVKYGDYNIENKKAILQIADNDNLKELLVKYYNETKDNSVDKTYFPAGKTPKTFIEKVDKIQNYFIRKEQVKQGTIQKVNEMIEKNMEQNQNESSPF